jgi:hypothetical protein
MADQDEEWTQWGRRADFVAPKPLSPRRIAKLGDALDRADRACSAAWHGDTGRYWLTPDCMPGARFYSLCDRRYRAEVAYVRAINARDLAAMCKMENATRSLTSRAAFELRHAMFDAQAHLEEIEEAGEDFSTNRERIDAQAAADLAERLYVIAERNFRDAERGAKITGNRRRSRSSAPLVTDGYVKTGKYKVIDGVRLPVLEKVE